MAIVTSPARPLTDHPHSALPHVGENVAAFSELHQILRVGAAAYV
jgi:hypothetical protein